MKPFEPLLAWLAWQRDATDHLQGFQDTRLAWLARQIAAELASPAADAPADLATLWSALSLDAVDRILRAPSVCQCLRVGTDPAALRRALTAEFILDQHPDLRVDHWSALGDVWLGDAPPQPPGAVLRHAPDGRYHAPALACGIPIDLSLPAAIAYPGAGVPRPDLPDAPQTAASLTRLDEAVARIAGAAPAMHRSVLELVSNIVLRTDHAAPQRLQSASSAASLGRVVLVNAHAPDNSTALLAEVLIHEATHTAISTVELEAPLVTDTPGLARCCIASPWTGASLPVHAFLHACLVWFALSGFWARLDQEDSDTRAEAGTRRATIRQGFRALQPDTALAPYRDRLHDDAIPLLHAVREKALTA
ncbi:MAG TPA: HEXXH motif-containing putative peptide modification protein [Acetobacteraceae bacterium]|nr:HEXXH motif-containing putative peptide modification protein [Acetobacteraceae bacterium]